MSVKLKINNYKNQEQTNVPRIPTALLEEIKEEGMRDMFERFYERLRVSPIKHLFPVHSDEAFEKAKQHAGDFFIQICGGPDYFNQNRGAPMMKKRHLPFYIDNKARVIWLDLFRTTINEMDNISDGVKIGFWEYLETFSYWMVNAKD
jgi:hemoglobin